MKKVIWKYEVAPHFTLDLPVSAQILHVARQHDLAVMWVLLDAEANKVRREFMCIATGEPIRTALRLDYIGTFLLGNDELVFHLFEVI